MSASVNARLAVLERMAAARAAREANPAPAFDYSVYDDLWDDYREESDASHLISARPALDTPEGQIRDAVSTRLGRLAGTREGLGRQDTEAELADMIDAETRRIADASPEQWAEALRRATSGTGPAGDDE